MAGIFVGLASGHKLYIPDGGINFNLICFLFAARFGNRSDA
jgi:hypothetical protein